MQLDAANDQRADAPPPTGRATRAPSVGCLLNRLVGANSAEWRRLVARAEAVGLDHMAVGDHVSFRNGSGADGLLAASTVLGASERLATNTAVYLLPLRHPVLVARQLADISAKAPGRFLFGVGIGGEDRHELEICGVDPTTRGRRMSEYLQAVRAASHRTARRIRRGICHPRPGSDSPAGHRADPDHHRRTLGRGDPPGRAAGRWLVRHLGVSRTLRAGDHPDATSGPRGRTRHRPVDKCPQHLVWCRRLLRPGSVTCGPGHGGLLRAALPQVREMESRRLAEAARRVRHALPRRPAARCST